MSVEISRWRKVLAQDEAPTEEKLVDDFKKRPIANWKEYTQLVVRVLSTQLGAEIDLVGPSAKPAYGGSSSFVISGGIKFVSPRPIEVLKQYGNKPLRFAATVAGSSLVEPIVVSVQA